MIQLTDLWLIIHASSIITQIKIHKVDFYNLEKFIVILIQYLEIVIRYAIIRNNMQHLFNIRSNFRTIGG